ncbi:MAG: ATP-binding protein, partial [Thermoplasmata archaeon]|nr:ATP-binding protein [Thermoplasmata archaeon]
MRWFPLVVVAGPTEWVFQPRPFLPRPDRADPPRAPLEVALRAGHAMGVDFEVGWTTGPSPEVTLAAAGDSGRRWMSQLVLPSFEIGQWKPRSSIQPGGAAPAVAERHGTRVGGVLADADADERAWGDTVVSALSAFPAGIRTRWRFRPGRPPRARPARPLGLEPEYQPPGFRLRPIPSAERASRDLESRSAGAPTWATELRAISAMGSEAHLERWAAVVSAASAQGGRGILAFRRPGRLLGTHPPVFLLGEHEVLAILPSRFTMHPPAASAAAGPRAQLTVGRDAGGGMVHLPIDRDQGRHLLVLGETGMGKSSLLVALARQAVHLGNVVLYDPLGETGEAFLTTLPSRVVPDVVWISPRSSRVAIDLLEAIRESSPSRADSDRRISDLVGALRRVRAARYPEAAFWGPRIEETVRATLRTASRIPELGLSELPQLLTMAGRRPVGVPEEARREYEELAAR